MYICLQLTVFTEMSFGQERKVCGELDIRTNLKKSKIYFYVGNIFIIFCGTAIKRTYLGNQLKKSSEIRFMPVAILELKLVIMTHPNGVRYRL